MNGLQALHDFILERVTTVEEAGPLQLVSVSHINAAGQPQEVHSLSRKAPGPMPWDDAARFAEQASTMLDNIARRHCSGLQGMQQLVLTCVHANENDKKQTTRTLPFLRAGTSNVGVHGALGSEAPTPAGVLETGKRWAEQVIEGAVAKDAAVSQMMITMLKEFREQNKDQHATIVTLWTSLKDITLALEDRQLKRQISQMVIDSARKMFPALASVGGQLLGAPVPPGVQEAMFFDAMVESCPPEQLRSYLAMLPPAAQGVAASMLADAQKRAQERGQPVNWQNAEAEAMGNAYRALRGPSPENPAARKIVAQSTQTPATTNGTSAKPPEAQSAGPSEPPTAGKRKKPKAHGATTTEEDERRAAQVLVQGGAALAEVLCALPDAQREMVLNMLSQGNADLAARVRAFHEGVLREKARAESKGGSQ